MLFSSSVFIFAFLPVVLLGYQLLGRFGRVAALGWLGVASLVFYGYWNPKFLILLLSSVLLNHLCAHQIARFKDRPGVQSAWLWAGVCANLGALAYFKYLFPLLGFLHEKGLASSFGQVILPLGISFFTFTQIAYLIDLKQGMAEPQDLISYNVFVTFFPHLIAGPIIHHSEMMPQFSQQRRFALRADDMAIGVSWFFMGLFKKVMLADRVAQVPDLVFAHPHTVGMLGAWAGVLCYSMQLYFDFSGYSDMALGLGRMFSIRFPLNFHSPYKAANIIEFWQRWHITLTRYLTLYLYNPIALWITRRRVATGKKVSKKASRTLPGFLEMVALPLLTTLFLAGIWHGAGLQFIVFGVLHGIYLTINHAWRLFVKEDSVLRKLLPSPVSVLLTYFAVIVAQIYFKASSAGDATFLLGNMLGLHGRGAALSQSSFIAGSGMQTILLRSPHALVGVLAVYYFIVWALPNTQELLDQVPEGLNRTRSLVPSFRWSPNFAWGLTMAVAFFIVLLFLNASTSFLYFQF